MEAKSFAVFLIFLALHSHVNADYKNPLPLCNSSANVWSLCNGQRSIGDGQSYKGVWYENLPHGLGELIGPNGETIKSGLWEKGRYTGPNTVPQDFPQCSVDQPHWNLCRGKSVVEDNLVYEGTWVNGKPHGSGRTLTPSGTLVLQGMWHQGTYSGAEPRPTITTTTVRPPSIPGATPQLADQSGNSTQREGSALPRSRVAPALMRNTCKAVPYPMLARRYDAQGAVVVLFTANERGAIVDAAVDKSSGETPGHKELDNAAIEIVKSCTARPGLLDGKPAVMSGRIEWIFRLE